MSRYTKAFWAGVKEELKSRVIVKHHMKGWTCGHTGHFHDSKTDAEKCFAIWWSINRHRKFVAFGLRRS